MTNSIRVRSSGEFGSMEITTSDGSVIEGVVSLAVKAQPKMPPTIELEIVLPMLDINGILEEIVYVCPGCKKETLHTCVIEDTGP